MARFLLAENDINCQASCIGNREPFYGFGDAQFWHALKRLSRASRSLLSVNDGIDSDGSLTPDNARRATFALTDDGRAVLNGAVDFIALNGIDLWLVGIHLNAGARQS